MGADTDSADESTGEMMAALTKYAPGAIRAMTDVSPYVSQKQMEINQMISPQQSALETDIYGTYGPQINAIASDLDQQRNLRASESELALAKGPGYALVGEADRAQRLLDPEFYAGREKIGAGVNSLMDTASPTLSATEMEQINRAIAGRDGPMAPSAMNTVKNAMTFGDAGMKKWQGFGNTLAQASGALAGTRSNLPGFEIATRRQVTPFGESRLSSPQQVSLDKGLDTTFGFAGQTLSQIGESQRQAQSMKKGPLDIISGVGGAVGGMMAM